MRIATFSARGPTHNAPAHVATTKASPSEKPRRLADGDRLYLLVQPNGSNAAGGYAEVFRFEPVYPFSDIRVLLPSAPACGR